MTQSREHELLREAGLRVTEPRRRALAVLAGADRPLTHAEVEARLDPPLDRVTLYRVLRALEEAGVLQAVTVGGARRYGLARHAHAHFTCRCCDRTVCLAGIAVPHPPVPAGFVVEGAELNLRGLCPACACREETS